MQILITISWLKASSNVCVLQESTGLGLGFGKIWIDHRVFFVLECVLLI
jgi:hypothetical protein